jgi:hypothetical protein
MKHNGIIRDHVRRRLLNGRRRRPVGRPAVHAGTAPTRWEYQCAIVDSNDNEVVPTLNKFGAEGWELVSTTPHASGGYVRSYMLCAKRALP